MKRVLIVKVTSLGDIVQALPVVADIKRAFPGVQVDWAADEAFAEVAQWSENIDRVLYAPLRRFKKARRWADLKSIWASIAELRAYRYDFILDIQGVYKSAIIAFLARSSRRIGYRAPDLGEQGAAFAYTGRFGPRPKCNAWHGMRINAGEALGYEIEGEAVFKLRLPEPVKLPFAVDRRTGRGVLSRHLERRQEMARRPLGGDWPRTVAARLSTGIAVGLGWRAA